MITTTILGMKEEKPSWGIASFLNEHDWHERKDNLTIEQRRKFAECVDYKKKEFKGYITERDLALIFIDSLDEVEEQPGKLKREFLRKKEVTEKKELLEKEQQEQEYLVKEQEESERLKKEKLEKRRLKIEYIRLKLENAKEKERLRLQDERLQEEKLERERSEREIQQKLEEECKIPKKFTTHTQTYHWLYRAIMNDSPQEIKKVFKHTKELYSSFPNYPQNEFVNDLFNNCKLPYINQKPLICAISLARSKAVKALLELSADPNISTQEFPRPIDYALQLGDPRSALELVKAGADFKERTDNPGYPTGMGRAIGLFNQDPEICSQLIQEMFDRGYCEQKFGPQTNERNTNVWALALTASQYGLSGDEEISVSLIDLFIKNGCDINKTVFFDQVGVTPLAIALNVRNMHNIELLLEAKADPNKQFTYGGRFVMRYKIRNTNGFITPLQYTQQMVLNKYPEAQEVLELLSRFIKKQSEEKVGKGDDGIQRILKKYGINKEN